MLVCLSFSVSVAKGVSYIDILNISHFLTVSRMLIIYVAKFARTYFEALTMRKLQIRRHVRQNVEHCIPRYVMRFSLQVTNEIIEYGGRNFACNRIVIRVIDELRTILYRYTRVIPISQINRNSLPYCTLVTHTIVCCRKIYNIVRMRPFPQNIRSYLWRNA